MISIIIVNYKSVQLLHQCLGSIAKHSLNQDNSERVNFEVIIVNNDIGEFILAKNYPFSTQVINVYRNIGFGPANNLGAKKASGRYLFFLNPDTELTGGSLENMFAYLEQNQNVGVLGPKIILKRQNRPQPWTCGKKTSLGGIIFRNTFKKPWNKPIASSVDWISGTAMMVRKDLFDALGGFDEQFFMYFEDQDLCIRIKQLGKEVLFFPYARVDHYDGKSWENQRQKKEAYYSSQDYFFKKHYGNTKAIFLKLLRFIAKGT